MGNFSTNLRIFAVALAIGLSACTGQDTAPTASDLQLPTGASLIDLPGDVSNLGNNSALAFAGFDPSGTVALLGTGYNSIASTIRGQCVDGQQPLNTVRPSGAGVNTDGQKITYDYRQATQVSQLRKSLNIETNASFGIGIYSGSGSAHFFESSAIDSLSSYLIVDVTVINQVQTLTRLRMADFAKAKMDDPVAFKKTCGDRFVQGLRTGGQFTAVVRFSARSEEYKRQLDASLSGKIGELASGSIKFNQMLQSMSSTSTFTIEILKKGGTQSLPALNDLDQYVRNFAREVNPTTGSPWPIEAILNDYDVVEDYNGNVDFAYPVAEAQMERLAQARDEAVAMRNDISLYRNNPDDFGAIDRDKALADERALNTYITRLVELARTCTTAPSTGCTEAVPPLPAISTRPGGGAAGGAANGAAAGKIGEMEALFARRGNPANLDALVAGLSDTALQPMTQRDRYRARLLLAQTYLWRVMMQTPIFEYPFKDAEATPMMPDLLNDDVLRFRAQLAAASDLAGKMPSLGNATCELGYLRIRDELLKRPLLFGPDTTRYDAEIPGLMSRVDALRATTTIDKKPCDSFDNAGLDRISSRLNDEYAGRLLNKNERDAARAAWTRAVTQIRKANLTAPDYPGNIFPMMTIGMHHPAFTPDNSLLKDFCRALTRMSVNGTPAAYAGLDPAFGTARNFASEFLPRSMCPILLSRP